MEAIVPLLAVNIHANRKSEFIYNANYKAAQLYRRLLI